MHRSNTLYKPKKRIYKWIGETIADGSWQKHNDLHIDMIDERHERNKRNWMKSSITYLLIAKKYLHENKIPFSLHLFVDLGYKLGNDIYLPKTYNELLNDLTDSPPSLYLWDEQVTVTPDKILVKKPLPGFLKLPNGLSATYSQYYDAEYDETSRYVYVE